MKNKQSVTWQDTDALAKKLIKDIEDSGFEPEIVVGIARSGLMPATMISYYFGCPMQPLVWSNTKPETQESNLWLPDDATAGKHTLIVDGITRTGKTLQGVIDDWDLSVFANIDWGNTVKLACLHMHDTSELKPEYVGEVITNDTDILYPWEKQ
jgi:hypoxanthine phosphoribosyltransferase